MRKHHLRKQEFAGTMHNVGRIIEGKRKENKHSRNFYVPFLEEIK